MGFRFNTLWHLIEDRKKGGEAGGGKGKKKGREKKKKKVQPEFLSFFLSESP